MIILYKNTHSEESSKFAFTAAAWEYRAIVTEWINWCVKSCALEVYSALLILGKSGQGNPNSGGRRRIKI